MTNGLKGLYLDQVWGFFAALAMGSKEEWVNDDTRTGRYFQHPRS